MEKLKDVLTCLFGGLLVLTLVLLCMLCVLTPEKDKFGQYTQPLDYWTSEEYFQSHF